MFEFGSIRLRPIEREDLKVLHEWENDFELIMYSRSRPINFVNMAQLEKQYEEWAKSERELHFIVELTASREAIGIARLEHGEWGNIRSASVGTYIGKKELWDKGLGRYVTVALLEIAFNQLNMERCEAWSVEYNRRAHRVLEACGFRKAGVMRCAAFVNGRKWDGVHFDILLDDYKKIRADLLRETLKEQLEDYTKRHCTIVGS